MFAKESPESKRKFYQTALAIAVLFAIMGVLVTLTFSPWNQDIFFAAWFVAPLLILVSGRAIFKKVGSK